MSRPAQRGAAARRRPVRNATPRTQPVRPRSIWDDLPVQEVPTENLPSFAELGLPAERVAGLARRGVATPVPSQAATLPEALRGRDVLGRAATGSGKTLAFGLAMITRLGGAQRRPRRPRGLVLVPTRELAMQVADTLAPAGRDRGLRTMIVAGGLPIQKQIATLVDGVDIVVATPGRLEDLIERRACQLDEVRVTVLDEADHMADLGFLPAVRRILDQTPSDGQRLLFSATLDGDVATLVEQYLVEPSVHALSTAGASVSTMSHHVFRVPFEQKFDLTAEIANRGERTILFVRTKHGADRIAKNLNRAGVAAGALHGDRTQAQRTRALAAFKDGSVPVLVATDVAARGIHVDDVSLVLHVDPPADVKDYLHRSGRTARAGDDGTVVMLVTSADERKAMRMLSDGNVDAEVLDASAGHPDVVRITGARTPSGVPVAAPQQTKKPQGKPGGKPSGKPGARPHGKFGTKSGKPYGSRTAAPEGEGSGDGQTRGSAKSGRPPARSGGPARSGAPARHPQSGERRPRRDRTH